MPGMTRTRDACKATMAVVALSIISISCAIIGVLTFSHSGYTMQRRELALLPGESAPIFTSRHGSQSKPTGVRSTQPTQPHFQRAAGRNEPHVQQDRASIEPLTEAPVSAAEARARVALADDYRAGQGMANLDEYFVGTLNGFKDDTAILDPMHLRVQEGSVFSAQTPTPLPTSIAGPAIFDIGVFLDSLILPSSLNGYINGEIPFQFSDLMGLSPPERIISLALTQFRFPHIYNADFTAFDAFYFGRLYVTARFIPITNQVQDGTPNTPFTFECAITPGSGGVDEITPLDPHFIMRQPISATNIIVKFQMRVATGGFINCPIPPTRVVVARTPANPTMFTIMDGADIGALAPVGAGYSVPILVRPSFQATWTPPAGLQTLLYTQTGFRASNFIGNTFTIPLDTTMWLGPPAPPPPLPAALERYDIIIPKNSVAFGMRFTCLSEALTNSIMPTHN